MGYHDKNYTNKNNDVVLLGNTIDNLMDILKTKYNADLKDLAELSEQLKGFDLSVSTRRGFQKNIDIFSNLYRIFVKINTIMLYEHSLEKDSIFNLNNLRKVISKTNRRDSDIDRHTEINIRELEYFRFVNGYGCSLVSLISLAYKCKKRFTMLPMFKLFLEDFNNFMDIGSYYKKALSPRMTWDGEKYKIIFDATVKHLEEKAQTFGKLDYYTVSSIDAIRNDRTNANSNFDKDPKSFFAWENEYEFSVLNKYLGPEIVIKIILLLALNTLSVYNTYK